MGHGEPELPDHSGVDSVNSTDGKSWSMGTCAQVEGKRDDRRKVGSPKMKMPERLPEFRLESKHPESHCLHFIIK